MAKHPQCWANALDDCSGAIEGEHIISMGAFHPGESDRAGRSRITVTSQSWRGTMKHRLANLTSNMLCAHHNRVTSDLDAAGGSLAAALHGLIRMTQLRPPYPLRWTPWIRDLDGVLVERWLLKTAVNCAHSGGVNVPIGGPEPAPNWPTRRLVEQVFGLAPTLWYEGLWAATGEGVVVRDEDSFDIRFRGRDYLLGALIDVSGYPFVVSFVNDALPTDRLRDDPAWRNKDATHWPLTISDASRNLHVRFHWPERPKIFLGPFLG